MAEVGKKALSHIISTRILPELGFEKLEKPLFGEADKNYFKTYSSDAVGGAKLQIIIARKINHKNFTNAKTREEIVSALERHLRNETKRNDVFVEKVGASYFIKHPEISVTFEIK